MGATDKAIRILIAIIIAVLAYTKVITGVWAIVLLVIAVLFLATSLVSFCPAYWPFGINTGKNKN